MAEQQTNNEENQPAFVIEKFYVKDLSLEVPGAPNVFLAQEQPTVDLQVTTEGKPIEKGYYECVVGVTVTAKLPDGKALFVCEVKQAAVFRIDNIPEEEMEPILAIACPNILFPYARETVSDITTRAGFAPIILAPINFESMYLQQKAAQEEQEKSATKQ